MVTPEAAEAACWGCWVCMGLPFTGDTELDFPCCTEPPTVTGAAEESVAAFFVALAYDRAGAGAEAARGADEAAGGGEGVAVLCPC